MSDSSYIDYHRTLLTQLAETIAKTPPFNGGEVDELQAEFVQNVQKVLDEKTPPTEQIDLGRWLIGQIVSNYQVLMPQVPRALFWYFGGDCMHYLGDEEIAHFQMLEERYHDLLSSETEAHDFGQLVASIEQEDRTKLH